MKILDASIEWNYNSANTPDLHLLLDEIPPLETMRFKKSGRIFYATKDGYARFFSDAGSGPQGSGGSHISITLEDGSTTVLKGPWSGNSGSVNDRFPNHCIEASVTTDLEAFLRGYTLLAGAVTIPVAIDAAFVCGVYLVKYDSYGSHMYTFSVNPNKIEKPGYVSEGNRVFLERYRILEVLSYPRGVLQY